MDEQLCITKQLLNCISIIENIFNKKNIKITGLKLANVVITIILKEKIERSNLIVYLQTTTLIYKVPLSFSGISVKLNHKNCKITAIFFSSGKILLVGLNQESIQQLDIFIKQVGDIVENLNSNAIKDVKISNKVYKILLNKNNLFLYACIIYKFFIVS